jgi:site-specific recombinase XerD
MITFEPIIIPNHKRQDGTFPVKIRIYYKGKCRRLPTTLVCYPSDLTRTKRKSVKIKKECAPREKAKELIKRMRAITDYMTMDELEDRDVDWIVEKIKDGLKEENFQLDFFEWGEKFIQQKKPATRNAYTRSLNAFERFLKKRTLDINAISKMMLQDFMEFVDAEPKMRYDRKTKQIVESKTQRVPKAASSLMVMKLGHIYDAAKERYNDEDSDIIRIPKSPFKYIRKVFPVGDQAQEALSKEVIQQIISAQTDDPKVRIALDAFVVSFALMGANLADLYLAKTFPGKEWIYNRAKITSRKAEMRVNIPVEIEPYIKRLQEGDDKGYWLPKLHKIGKDKDICGHGLNIYLRRWENGMGLKDFTFYAARHSWGTIARSLGVDLASVNECLCHKDKLEMGRIYASLSWEQKNEINRKVIDAFVWE